MATFPALRPATRVFTPAVPPSSGHRSMRGQAAAVQHSNALVGGQLALTFAALSMDEMLAAMEHYWGQGGPRDSFQLSPEVFDGTPDLAGGGGTITPLTATYNQSSCYSANTPATFATMTNGVYSESTSTGTDDDAESWIRLDLGNSQAIATVVVGCDFDTQMLGDWGPQYTENLDIQGSTDGDTWQTIGNTGTFTLPIQSYNVSGSFRYVRLLGSSYICATEFYASADALVTPSAYHGRTWRYPVGMVPQVAETPERTNRIRYDIELTLEMVS